MAARPFLTLGPTSVSISVKGTVKQQIGQLERIKRTAGPLINQMPSCNMRDRARLIYNLAKELQDDLAKMKG